MLQRRDSVPHFVVTTIDGREVRYAEIWQRRFLVLVCAVPHPGANPDSQPTGGGAGDGAGDGAGEDGRLRTYAAELVTACAATGIETSCVVTRMAVAGVPRPGALVADRYGEIAFISEIDEGQAMPAPGELADWVHAIGIRCS